VNSLFFQCTVSTKQHAKKINSSLIFTIYFSANGDITMETREETPNK
jgi:hypothetical protein